MDHVTGINWGRFFFPSIGKKEPPSIESKFAFPVKNSDGTTREVKSFDAEMLIRNASDGKKYLYDIVNISENTPDEIDLTNKETRSAAAKTAAATRGSVSKNTLADTSDNVKTEEKEDASCCHC